MIAIWDAIYILHDCSKEKATAFCKPDPCLEQPSVLLHVHLHLCLICCGRPDHHSLDRIFCRSSHHGVSCHSLDCQTCYGIVYGSETEIVILYDNAFENFSRI
ncbi:hypothetical protein MDA_GLEAN10022822 [Myotis davidii]|uniref:Uncharacterized protein n=1 Tax=Myotis davidii TaxID=225400 RepID=L5M340_MYODS|nr:hypothetical protein MDA_GLEAN10022822 [Myotis davidii]